MSVYAIWSLTPISSILQPPLVATTSLQCDGPTDYHTDRRDSDREGEILYDISYMYNFKRNDTNELHYKIERLTVSEKKIMFGAGKRVGQG